MKPKRIIRTTVLAILMSLSLLSGTTIWANSSAFEDMCIYSQGRCLSYGCSDAGGVCGMPEIDRQGKAAAFDPCWCLF